MVNALAGVRNMLREAVVGLATYMVQGVEEEAARAASRVEYQVVPFRAKYFNGKGYQLPGREILAEVPFEEAAHEFLESDALGVQLRAI